MIGRKSLLTGALLLACGCLLGAVGVTLTNPSPQQAASARESPSLPPPTAQVKNQSLAQTIEGACQLSAQETPIHPPSVTSHRLVVTSAPPTAGVEVTTGMVLVTVSGEPLVALVSAVPFYRDLTEGDRGPDVRALEEGLVAAKLIAQADDTFGADTATAIGKINHAAGLDGHNLDLAHSVAVPSSARVSAIQTGVGEVVTADSTLMTVSTGANRASCQVPTTAAVSVGDRLSLISSATTIEVQVASVSPQKDAPGQSAVAVTADKPLPDGAHLEIKTSESKPTLTVPAGALITSPSGTAQVRKLAGGQPIDVDVTVGMSAGGWVAVTGTGLAAGDAVQLRTA